MNAAQPETSVRYLFLPIETKTRELDAKLLLACFAAERGVRTILGEQQEMRAAVRRFPPGQYVDKSVVKSKRDFFHTLRLYGHRIAAWCEEGLIYSDPALYLSQRIAVESFGLLDVFFAWGDMQRGHVLSKAGLPAVPVIASGNPRTDLLRQPFRDMYVEQGRHLRETHGRFILINTNFSFYNHIYSPEYRLQQWLRRGRVNGETEIREYWNRVEFTKRIFHAFADMVGAVAARFPGTTIVVRPHPSENYGRWEELTRHIPNVRVIHEGSVFAWIAASAVVIHNSCTTGLEAFLMDTPVLAYLPIRAPAYEKELPNAVSEPCETLDVLLTCLSRIVEGNDSNAADRPARWARAKQYLGSLDGAFACERILDALMALPAPRGDTRRLTIAGRVALWLDFWRQQASAVRRAVGFRRRHAVQKFPALSLEEVCAGIKTFQRLSGRFQRVIAERVEGLERGYCIRAAD